MALEGIIVKDINYEYGHLEFRWKSVPNIVENKSTETVEVYYIADQDFNDSFYDIFFYGILNIEGGKINQYIEYDSRDYGDLADIKAGEERKIATITRAATHNYMGTLTMKVRFTYEIYGSSTNPSITPARNKEEIIFYYSPDRIETELAVITADSFNDEGIPSFTYALGYYERANGMYAYSGAKAFLSFDGENPLVSRDLQIYANTLTHTYTYELTDAERELLIKSVTNGTSCPIYYCITTTYDTGDKYTQKLEKTFTLIDATPTLNPIVEDGREETAALTGDVNTFIRYQSQAVYAINAQASKGATIIHQQITNGSQINTNPYGSIDNVESGTFLFTVTDSRNNIAYQVIEKPIVNYERLTCNIEADNPDTTGNVNFVVKGNYFNASFGVKTNTLALSYRYKVNSGDYTEWVVVTPTIKNNTYSVNVSLTGFSYQDKVTLQAKAIDLLTTIESAEKVLKAQPVFDWSENDFNFNVPVAYTDGNKEYSITDAAVKLDAISAADLNKLAGLMKSLSNRYELTCEVGESIYYSSATVSLYLYGNMVRGYLSAVRNETIAAGNQANELVCQVEFDSGKKITGFGAVSFISGTEGGLASFQMTDTLIYPDDGSISPESVGKGKFNITLCATGAGGDRFNAYFAFPVLLDLSKY